MDISSHISPKSRMRLKSLGAVALLLAIIPVASQSKGKDPNIGEAYLGNANSKVVLVEYGSLTCGHCADLATKVMPIIKKKYIDSNKIKYVFRTLPTQPAALSIGLQVIADCAGGQNRYELIDEFYHQQDAISAASASANGALKFALRLAKTRVGLDENKAKACLQDSNMISKIQSVAEWGDNTYKLTGTPTLLINGKDIDPLNANQFTVEFLSKSIDAALATKPQKGKKK